MADLKETILSIAGENRVLRWVIVVFSLCIATLVVGIVWRPPSPVWVVTEGGTIFHGDQKIVSWEPIEATRRALEILLVPTENRDLLVAAFFDESLAGQIIASKPKDPFISFQIKTVTEEKLGEVIISGVLLRPDKPKAELTVNMVKRNRTELNPFGLVVTKTTLQVDSN
jgi:hypothetical protein